MKNSKTRHIFECNQRLEKRFLNERLEMVQLEKTYYPNVKYDFDGTNKDFVNRSLLEDLQRAAEKAGVTVTITTAKSGHSSERSRHATQTAVDISIINGEGSGGATSPYNGNPKFREYGNKLKDALVNLGYSLNVESGNQKAVLWQTSTGGNHFNHLHVSNNGGASTEELHTYTSDSKTKTTDKDKTDNKKSISSLSVDGEKKPISTDLSTSSTPGETMLKNLLTKGSIS